MAGKSEPKASGSWTVTRSGRITRVTCEADAEAVATAVAAARGRRGGAPPSPAKGAAAAALHGRAEELRGQAADDDEEEGADGDDGGDDDDQNDDDDDEQEEPDDDGDPEARARRPEGWRAGLREGAAPGRRRLPGPATAPWRSAEREPCRAGRRASTRLGTRAAAHHHLAGALYGDGMARFASRARRPPTNSEVIPTIAAAALASSPHASTDSQPTKRICWAMPPGSAASAGGQYQPAASWISERSRRLASLPGMASVQPLNSGGRRR